jgi:hypothetical protein
VGRMGKMERTPGLLYSDEILSLMGFSCEMVPDLQLLGYGKSRLSQVETFSWHFSFAPITRYWSSLIQVPGNVGGVRAAFARKSPYRHTDMYCRRSRSHNLPFCVAPVCGNWLGTVAVSGMSASALMITG